MVPLISYTRWMGMASLLAEMAPDVSGPLSANIYDCKRVDKQKKELNQPSPTTHSVVHEMINTEWTEHHPDVTLVSPSIAFFWDPLARWQKAW